LLQLGNSFVFQVFVHRQVSLTQVVFFVEMECFL
jgi:hypothetical protein